MAPCRTRESTPTTTPTMPPVPGADQLLRHSPFQWAAARLAQRRLTVLTYHSVDDPELFARHLDHLVAHTHPVSLADLEVAIDGGAPLPARPVLITFDDADRSLVEHALPLLGARLVPAAAFVVAGLVGTDEAFWWDEVAALADRGFAPPSMAVATPQEVVRALKLIPDGERRAAIAELRARAGGRVPDPRRQLTVADVQALAAGGIAIGSHSLTHPCLDRCTDAVLAEELTRSRALLGEMLGRAPDAVAYPNGNYDGRVVVAAARRRLPGRVPLRPPARTVDAARSDGCRTRAGELRHRHGPLRHHRERTSPRDPPCPRSPLTTGTRRGGQVGSSPRYRATAHAHAARAPSRSTPSATSASLSFCFGFSNRVE